MKLLWPCESMISIFLLLCQCFIWNESDYFVLLWICTFNSKNAIIPAKLALFVSHSAAFMGLCCRVILSETHCKFHPTPRHVSSFFESALFLSESHAFHNISDETRGQMEWVKHCLTLKFKEKERGKNRKQGEERSVKVFTQFPQQPSLSQLQACLTTGGFHKQSHPH